MDLAAWLASVRKHRQGESRMQRTLLPFFVVFFLPPHTLLEAQTTTQVTKTGYNDWDLNPVLSRDGRTLAWIRQTPYGQLQAIWVADTWRHTYATIKPSVSVIMRLFMSGDGQTLFYLAPGGIWSVPVSGGPSRLIPTTNAVIPYALSASYDGSMICYSTVGGGRAGLIVQNVVTSKVVDVTRNVPFTPTNVTGDLSGDGKLVVLAANSNTRSDLWLAQVDGTLIRRLYTGPAMPLGVNPRIDDYGSACAFDWFVLGSYRLFSFVGPGPWRYPVSPNQVAWSRGPMIARNGDRVTWLGEPTRFGGGDIHMAYVDGTGYRVLAHPSGVNVDITPFTIHTLSGDGTVAAFSTLANYLGGNPEQDWEIYLWKDSLTRSGTPSAGATITFHMQDASEAGGAYIARCALSRAPGLPLPGVGTVPLTPDALCYLAGQAPSIFRNFAGVLDSSGAGSYSILIPPLPGLRGFVFYTTFLTVKKTFKLHPAVKVIVR